MACKTRSGGSPLLEARVRHDMGEIRATHRIISTSASSREFDNGADPVSRIEGVNFLAISNAEHAMLPREALERKQACEAIHATLRLQQTALMQDDPVQNIFDCAMLSFNFPILIMSSRSRRFEPDISSLRTVAKTPFAKFLIASQLAWLAMSARLNKVKNS